MYYDIGTAQEEAAVPSRHTSDIIEQRNVNLNVSSTAGNSSSFVEVTPLNEAIPVSFLNALLDFQTGRVVDIDVALTEPPPDA
jgi:hypothetical protein